MEGNGLVQQTFFHELGHFVSRELNKSLYSLGKGVEEIILYSKPSQFLGRISLIDKTENYSLPNAPQDCANLIYGCIFQTLHLNFIQFDSAQFEFLDCFDLNAKNGGAHDCQDFNKGPIRNYVKGKAREGIIEYVSTIYLNEVQKDFHLIHDLNFKEYSVVNKNGNYSVLLKKLNDQLTHFFEIHSFNYKILIEKIIAIIEASKKN